MKAMLDLLNAIRKDHALRIKALRNIIDVVPAPPNTRQILGEIGGEARRYRHKVMMVLTEWATQHTVGADLTKFRTQAWQKAVFGRSVSNSVAVKWCRHDRECGERGALNVPEPISSLCARLYQIYRPVPDRPLATPHNQAMLQQLIDKAAAQASFKD